MPESISSTTNGRQRVALLPTLTQIAAVWGISDAGYYFLLPPLGVAPGYNNGPVAIALYYVFWVGISVILFWPLYATWPHYAKWSTFENRLISSALWTGSYGGSIAFAAYVLPLLPIVNWTESWTPPEFIVATPWFFLPKSIDILFQQRLIVALVLVMSAQGFGLRKISLYCAMLFGAMHVFLAFGDVPVRYVVRFMISAGVFGLIFPYFILRVRNGLAFSYLTHWLYYVVSVTLPHIFMSSAK